MFSVKHSFAEIKECKLKKPKIYQKLGAVCQHAKVFLFVFCFFFFSLCFFLFVFACLVWKKPPKGYFLAVSEFFLLFVPPKGLSLISSYSVLFPCFPFVFPFKIPYFSLLFVHQPLLENVFSVFCLSLLPFPLLMFACFFETSFPNIPFLKPNLLSFLVVFFQLFLLLFSLCMFLPFCFYVGFVMGMFFICFSFVACFAFRL